GSFAVNNDVECELTLFQDGGNLNRSPVGNSSSAALPFGYIQATTIIIGRMLALVYSTDNPKWCDFQLCEGDHLTRIWPAQDKPIELPRMMQITWEEAEHIINILQKTSMPLIPDGDL